MKTALQNSEKERARQIEELEALWKLKTGKDLDAFDRAIMKRFETTEGRPALSFESIRTVRAGLQQLKDKNKGEK